MAELTILMPAYNAAPYIEEAVSSLLNQTYTDFELWILNDASTDDTLPIVKALAAKDSRISIFSNAVNQGKLKTVNAKVKSVESPFFTITDADDVSHPVRIEKQMAVLNSHPQLVMCGTAYAVMDEQGYYFRTVHVPVALKQLRERSLVQSAFMGGTMLMRTTLLQDFTELYRLYFENCMEDADLACRILDKYEATNIDTPLYFYRIVPSSLTRAKVTMRSLKIYKLIAYLSFERRRDGKDCMELGNYALADEFILRIAGDYAKDSTLLCRHQSFFYMYWGQHLLAFNAIIKALSRKPYHAKTILSFFLISIRIIHFHFLRSFKKVHYHALFK